MLILIPEDSDNALIGPVPDMQTGKAYATVQRIVLSLDFTPRIIAMTMDSYGYRIDGDPEIEQEKFQKILDDRKRKSFKQMFEEGNPNVYEMLGTIVLSSDKSYMVNQTYRYTDADGFEWDEPVVSDEGSDWDFDRLINGRPKLDNHGRPLCPICGGYIPNNATPGEYPGALSRVDNTTEICSDCGTQEALNDFFRRRDK